MGFLAPYRVLDITDQRGLLAGQMFGRMGADVIQIEPPEGSPARKVGPFATDAPEGENSLHWSAYACNKRGITCALDTAEGRALFHKLIEKADFLFDCANAPSTHEALRAINPRLIQASITPFGSDGPKRDYADSELVVWASAGPLWPNRDHNAKPLRISVPQAYLHAAADATSGAMMALFARHRSGQGQHVDVSAQQSASLATLSATLASAVGHPNFSFSNQPPAGKKKTLDLSGSGARTRRSKWQARDGLVELHVGMGPAAGRFANQLFGWMREEGAVPQGVADWDWVELPKLLQSEAVSDEQVDEARAAVATFLSRFTKNEIMQIAFDKGLLMAPAMTVEDLRKSDHLAARDFFETIEENGRERTLPARFARVSGEAFALLRPAPQLGEHNEEVYGGLLGLASTEIENLRERRII